MYNVKTKLKVIKQYKTQLHEIIDANTTVDFFQSCLLIVAET